MTSVAISMRWTITLSLLAGFVIALFLPLQILQRLYDKIDPVVTMKAEVLYADEDGITIHLTAHKRRECALLGSAGFSIIGPIPTMRDAQMLQVNPNSKVENRNRPIGIYDFGTWRVWPTKGATRLEIWTRHFCGDREVFTKVVDIPV